ncbi:unnamed protein product [Closterium sp. NIES-54]
MSSNASFCYPSRAPGARRFSARRAPVVHDGFLPVDCPAVVRTAPTPPPPPFFSIPLLRVQQWGGGYGGGGCGARRVPARRAPCCRPSNSYTAPHLLLSLPAALLVVLGEGEELGD